MKPEISSILPGLCLSLVIFGIKAGTGLSYVWARASSRFRGVILVLAAMLAYAAIFPAAYLLRGYWEKSGTGGAFGIGFFEAGGKIHIFWALMLFVWGTYLLISSRKNKSGRTKAWLLLAIPCPVCTMAIMLICVVLYGFFPDARIKVSVFSILLFHVSILLTIILFTLFAGKMRITPELMLGRMMLLISGYFIFSMLLSASAGEIRSAYALASYSEQDGGGFNMSRPELFSATVAATLFAAGFLGRLKPVRELKCLLLQR